MARAPEDDDKILRDLARGLKELDDNAELYQTREDYYLGKVGEVITHPSLAKLLAKYGDNFRFNYASVPVDSLNDRCDLSGITTGDDVADKRLRVELWDANELDDDADDYHLKAGYLGDYYAIGWPKPEDEVKAGEGVPLDLVGKHPINTRIIYSRENSRIALFAVTRWQVDKETWRAVLYYDDQVIDFQADKTGAQTPKAEAYLWLLDDEGERQIETHDYGFNVFHFRPDSKPYGTPINSKGYGPQDAITKIVSTQMAGLDYVGFPQRYALIDPDAQEGDDIADDFNSNGTVDAIDDDDDPSKVSNASKLSGQPGSAWLLSGVKSVGEFAAGDPDNFGKPLETAIRAMATLTRTPLREFVLQTTGSAPSGEAYRREDGPITKHATKVKGAYGKTWSQIGAWALGVWNAGSKSVEPVWLPSEVATDSEGMTLVGTKIQNGIPPRQALLEAGYTAEQVDGWLPEIKEDDPNAISQTLTPAVLLSLGQALQAFGAAKNLGAGTQEQIARIFARYLGTDEGPAPEPTRVPAPTAPVIPTTKPTVEPTVTS